jgi:TonB family protein
MKRLIFRLIVVLLASPWCALSVAAAQEAVPAGWVKVTPADEEFSVLLPRTPTVKEEQKTFEWLRVSGRRYRVKEGNTLYTIWSFKPEAVPTRLQQDKAAYLDLCAELAWDMLIRPELEGIRNSGQVVRVGDMFALVYHRELSSPTHPGRNYLLGIRNYRGAAQIYLGDARIYLVTALAESDKVAGPEAFMKSFSVGGKSLATVPEPTAAAVGTGGGVGPGRGVSSNNVGSNSAGSNSAGGKVEGGSAAESSPAVDYNKNFTARDVTKRASIRAKPEPTYTESARKFSVTGVVRLRLVLSATGQVTGITPITKLPHGLTQQAIEAARGIKFEPAIKDGRPVSQYVTIEYNFNIY